MSHPLYVYVPTALAVLAGIVWLVRLEGQVNMLKQEVAALKDIAKTAVTTATDVAVMKNDVQHMNSSLGEMKTLLINLVGPTQQMPRRAKARAVEVSG